MTGNDEPKPLALHPPVTARCSLTPDAGMDGLRQTRAWTRATLDRLLPGVDTTWVCDVVMVLDELMSNAVQHGWGCRQVQLSLHDRRILLQVTDASTAPARLLDSAVRGVSGLRLIENISTRWGQDVTARGKTVWAELPGNQPTPGGLSYPGSDVGVTAG